MTPPCVVPTFRPYTVENLEFGGFYASSCESRARRGAANHQALATGPAAPGCRCSRRLGARGCAAGPASEVEPTRVTGGEKSVRGGRAWIVLNGQKQLRRRLVKLAFEEISRTQDG